MPNLNVGKRVAVVGSGGHAKVVASALRMIGMEIVAFTSLDPTAYDASNLGAKILKDCELMEAFESEGIELVLGIGSIRENDENSQIRRVVSRYVSAGYRFIGFIHPSAWVATESFVHPTAQVHAGAVIQPGTVIAEYSIINTRVSLDHDCEIGKYCHIAPGSTLSGGVKVGDGVHLGTGSVVIQGIQIGELSFVGAGATVVSNVDVRARVRGVPARPF